MVVIVRLEMDDELMHGFKQVTGVHPRRKAVVKEVNRMVRNAWVGDPDETEDERPKAKTKKRKFRLSK